MIRIAGSGGVGGRIAGSAGGILFHGTEAGSDALEGVIRGELKLKEQEESVVDSVGGDVGLFDQLECFVSSEHLLHLLRESFLDGDLCRLALREEEMGLGSPGLQRSGEGESSRDPVSAGRLGSDVGAGDLPWLERSGR